MAQPVPAECPALPVRVESLGSLVQGHAACLVCRALPVPAGLAVFQESLGLLTGRWLLSARRFLAMP